MCEPQNIHVGQPVLAIEETGKRLSFNSRSGAALNEQGALELLPQGAREPEGSAGEKIFTDPGRSKG